jgi:hypothetical protein
MQFIVYGIDKNPEANTMPSPEVMAELGKFTEEAIKAGIILATGGVSATGTRVRLANGKVTVTDGPFIEAKELIGGFAVIKVNSLEEAVEWTRRFRAIIGDGESEIVPIFGPEV